MHCRKSAASRCKHGNEAFTKAHETNAADKEKTLQSQKLSRMYKQKNVVSRGEKDETQK